MSLSDWKEYKIADLVEIIFSGGTPNTKVNEYWNGSLPWLSSGETKNRYINSTEKTITESGAQNSSTRLALSGDVVMASAGQGYTRGQVSFLNVNTFINQSVIAIRANEKLLDKKFLFYNLSNRYEELRAISDSNSIRGSITTKMVKSMTINIPNLDTQKSIANVLSSIDDKIENNKKINHHLEQIAQVLFEQVYYDGSSAQLGDALSTLESGSRPKGGAELDGIPSIGAENIERFGQYDYTKEKFISHEYFKRLNRGVVHSGDVLLYKDGAYTGKVSMALDGFPHAQCAVNEHIFILRPNELAPSSFFLYFLLLNSENKQALFSRASSKAAQPGLNQTEVKTLPILLPKIEKIVEFDNTIAPFMHQITKNANENRKLSTLRDTLLPKLLSGEISVN